MAKRNAIRTSKKDIADYWSANVEEDDLSIDFSEALERCWRCGCEAKLERCHIIPYSLGGKDTPSNLVLLCSMCHYECPNLNNLDFFWDWLKAHKASMYDTYWGIRGMREYEFIYKKTFIEEAIETGVTHEEIPILMKEVAEKASWHFGQSRFNPATHAGMLRLIIEKLRLRMKS